MSNYILFSFSEGGIITVLPWMDQTAEQGLAVSSVSEMNNAGDTDILSKSLGPERLTMSGSD